MDFALCTRCVNVTGPNGSTALLMAVSRGKLASIESLVAAGANLNAEALEFNDAKPVSLSISHPSVTRSTLHATNIRTERRGKPAVPDNVLLFFFKKHLFFQNQMDEKRVWFPLHCAVHMANVPALQMLLELGADPNCGKCTDGCTPLHSAQHTLASTTQRKMIRLLLAHGASPNATRTDGSGTSALHDAIEQGQTDSVRLLLRGRGDPNAATFDDGSTPLHIAVRWRQDSLNMVQMLAAFGARLDLVDMNNRTAKEWAVAKDRKAVVAWMEAVEGWSSLEVAMGCRLYADAALMLREGIVEPPQDPAGQAALLSIASQVPPSEPSRPVCRATVQLARDALRSWSPARHWLHHARHRQTVITVMLTAERLRRRPLASSQLHPHPHPIAASAPATTAPPQQQTSSVLAVYSGSAVSPIVLPPEMWVSILKFVLRSHFPSVSTSAVAGNASRTAPRTKPSSKLRPLLVI